MHRALIAFQESPAETLIIREPEALHHLSRVLRVQAGEAIECLDGKGARLQGSVQSVGRQEITVAVNKRVFENPPALKIVLAQSLIKQEHFEWVLQKATELGVARITPLLTARTTVRESGKEFSANRLLRWRRILSSAGLQCGCAWLPILDEPIPFDRAINTGKNLKFIFAAAADDKSLSMEEALKKVLPESEIALFFGPEGDFTEEEVKTGRQAGGISIWLGKRILRADTAAVAAVAMLQLRPGGLFSSMV